ncbi:hypothetical protein UFOVP422_29 [uncultured Caudovirales phage]|uniref:Uncharacterized protein n=1 Tax=uncultured Caudovirales phage TaxID=2100421 RepID=A0A6J5M4E9_9CAUD|nr:hypothetical protein UFOVP422_29 [uncultured Caudovirales phage]
MASNLWKVTLYAATTDTATSAYDTVPTSTIAALGVTYAYTAASFYITAPRATWSIESSSLQDISGARRGTSTRRRVFAVDSFPFAYNNGAGDQDIDVIDQLAGIIDSRAFLWARFEGGSRTWPSTSGTAHPVVVTEWGEESNDDAGTRRLSVNFEHRFNT